MTNRSIVVALAVALSIVSGSAFAQSASNQNREGMRQEQVPPNGQNARAQAAPVDPSIAVATKIVKWKNERVVCLTQAGLNRPTTGFGQRGDDFVITEQNRILIMDSVWARPGINKPFAVACTKVEE